jgi:hypothetical protein
MHLENIFPFETKLILIVGNLAQLPPICKHIIQNNNILCKSCHIKFAPCWKTTKQHFLSISMHHAIDLEYLQFINIIRERKPTTKEIQTILSQCFRNKQNICPKMDATTIILCTHKKNVEEYTNIVLQNNFQSQKILVKNRHKCYKY